jgi:hypothetical protein
VTPPDADGVVVAAKAWPSNAHLIADVARLGYLDGRVLDPTYGRGKWWTIWQPDVLTMSDIAPPADSPATRADFTNLWHADGTFDAVAFDPPYKLNGRPDPTVDEPYGVHQPATRDERMQLCRDGIAECARVLKPRGYLLVKCQDQVNGGKVRWQTIDFTMHAAAHGLTLVDRFDLLGKHRPQPMDGRRQEHAHGRPSTLLVFRKSAAG